MTDQIRDAIRDAIQRLHSDASDISILDGLDRLGDGAPSGLNITWKADEELHLGNFLAWTGPADNQHELQVLEAMSHTEIPAPRVVSTGSAGDVSIMLAHQAEGETIASTLAGVGMRWEISATAFAYARMLARIHALDWTTVTPWLADAESLAEDVVDDQVEAEFNDRAEKVDQLPDDWKPFVQRVIDWLELRRPVEVSLCLCHGDYHPGNIIAVGEDITAVVNWQRARVTDASRDLAMLPVWLNDIGLSLEDAELFAQAVQGAYLQESPRDLANIPYYSVAQPLDQLINRLTDAGEPPDDTELEAMQGTIERAMTLAGRVPWKSR